MPVNVFLSYSREDRSRAEAVVRALEARGCKVWWDGLLVGGTAFANTTEQALESAAAVVVLWSKISVESHWVRDEATRGRDRGCLVPATLDGTMPPLGFRQYQVIDLTRWRGRNDAPEMDAIHYAIRAAGGSADGAPPRPAQAPRAAWSRRSWLLGAGGVGAATLAGAGWFWWRRATPAPAVASPNSIAVLPFANLSSDKNQSYFSDGLTGEIRATLARNRRLAVIAQVSSEAAGEGRKDARRIAADLGVAFLLNGSVQRAGDMVRIATELVEGQGGFSRWAQSFDRPISNIFAVQSEIAAAVASALGSTLTPGAAAADPGVAAAQESGGTTNVAAFDAYLRGRALYNRSENEASDRAALAQFDAAIALDPRFAAAHSARARALLSIANQYARADQTAALYDAASQAAVDATTLAPGFADAQSTLGFVLFQGRLDIRGARQAYEKSYQSGAGDATVLGRYALYEALIGNANAAAPAMTRAVELDPLNPLVHRSMASVLYAARRYDDMAAPLERALALNAKVSRVHSALGNMLLQTGRTAAAHKEFAREPQAMSRLTGLAIAQHKLNQTAEANKTWQQLLADLGDSALYQQAQVQSQWGNKDEAMALLQRARKLGDSGLIYAQTDPLLDPLRSLPAFQQLLQQLGFD
jgi:TolB-like protein